MNIDGTMLFLFSLFPRVSAGPQKPQTLTASKTKYEKLGQKIYVFKMLGHLNSKYLCFMRNLNFHT